MNAGSVVKGRLEFGRVGRRKGVGEAVDEGVPVDEGVLSIMGYLRIVNMSR